jgi:hypothetical protein
MHHTNDSEKLVETLINPRRTLGKIKASLERKNIIKRKDDFN